VADQSNPASGHRARLRQRLFEGGETALLDHELVEYHLALAIPRRDTKTQAWAPNPPLRGTGPRPAPRCGTLRREGLSDGVVAALKIAEATALRLLETRIEGRPVLSSWDALGDYLQAAMRHRAVEEVRILFLNAMRSRIARQVGGSPWFTLPLQGVMQGVLAHSACLAASSGGSP